jgi:fructokinase
MATTLEAWARDLPDDVVLMVDPNCRPSITRDPGAYRARLARVLARADIVKASTEDLAFLRPGEPAGDAIAWLESLGPRVILVTDGGRPVIVRIDGARYEVAAPSVRIVDTVGAGDTFGGAFLACFVHGGGGRASVVDHDAVLRAARFAVRASAAVCGRAGADPPTLDELGGWPAV